MAAKKADDLGMGEVQAKADNEQKQGFVGYKVDPEPNSAYTAPVQRKQMPEKKESKNE